jgi:hypothetical protein
MPATTIGQQNLVFGLSSEAAIGIMQSFSESRTIERNEVRDVTGNIVGVAWYNPVTNYSLSATVTGNYNVIPSTALAALANATTFASNKVYIDSVTINKTNDGFVTVDVAAIGYPNLP